MNRVLSVVAVTVSLLASVLRAQPAPVAAEMEVGRLMGQQGVVEQLAISADGRIAISAAHDNDICVWDVTAAKFLRKLKGHTEPVMQLAITADGKRAISGGADHQVCVWDLANGDLISKVTFDTIVQGVAISDNGRIAAGGTGWDVLKIIDVENDKVIGQIDHDRQHIERLSLSPDGARIAVFAMQRKNEQRFNNQITYERGPGTLNVYRTADGKHEKTLEGMKHLQLLKFINGGKQLQWMNQYDSFGAFDVSTWQPAKKGYLHTVGQTLSVAMPADSSYLIFSNAGNEVKQLTNANPPDPARKLPSLPAKTNAVALSADGRTLLVGGQGPTVTGEQGFDARNNGSILVLNLGTKPPAKRFSAEKITLNASGTVYTINQPNRMATLLYDAVKGEQLPLGFLNGTPYITADGRTYVMMQQGKLNISPVHRGDGRKGRSLPLGFRGMTLLALSPDDRYAVVVPSNPVIVRPGQAPDELPEAPPVLVFDLAKPAEAAKLKTDAHAATGMAFSGDGKRLALAFGPSRHNATDGGSLQLWDLDSFKLVQKIPLEGKFHSPQLTSRDTVLAVKSRDVYRWKASTAEALAPLQLNDDIKAISASPDGARLLVAHAGGAIKLLDVEAGRLLHTIQLPEVKEAEPHFLPDGSAVAVVYRFDQSASVVPLELPK